MWYNASLTQLNGQQVNANGQRRLTDEMPSQS